MAGLSLIMLIRAGLVEEAVDRLWSGQAVENGELEAQGTTRGGATPLFLATVRGYVDLVHLLLLHGAMVNSRCRLTEATPLHAAADHDREEIAALLLRWGAEVNCRMASLDTPAHLAAYRGHLTLLNLLISHGANCLLKNNCGNDVIDEAIVGNQETIIGHLQWNKIRENQHNDIYPSKQQVLEVVVNEGLCLLRGDSYNEGVSKHPSNNVKDTSKHPTPPKKHESFIRPTAKQFCFKLPAKNVSSV